MFGLGAPELLIILVIALVVFGPKKIPEIANSLGKSINEFKKGASELENQVRHELKAADLKSAEKPAEASHVEVESTAPKS